MKIFSKIKWAIFVGSICLWVLSVDHIARETEKEITASLDTFLDSADSGLIKPALIDYNRSFLSSTLTISLSSDHPGIDSMLKDIVVTGKVQHGPLIITDQHIMLKTAHVDFSLYDKINADINEEMFSAQMSVDYDLVRQVEVKLNSLNLDIAGIELVSKEAFMNYAFRPDDKFSGEFEFSIPELRLTDRENQVQMSEGKVLLSLSPAGNDVDSLRFMAKNASLDINDVINEENVTLTAEVAFTDKDVVSFQTDMLSKDNAESSTTITVDNLNLDGFKDTFVGFLNYHNLSDQIDWTLEDSAYSPDGQDRLYELLGRLDENGSEMTDILANRVLTPNISRIQITQKGKTNFSADLRFLGLSNTPRQSPWYNSLVGTIQSNEPIPQESWFSQFEDYTTLTVSDVSEVNGLVQTQ